MVQRKWLLSLLLFVLVCCGNLAAQLPNFHFVWNPASNPSPSTVPFDDTLKYVFTLENTNALSFVDSMHFNMRTSLGTFRIASYDSVVIPANGAYGFIVTDSSKSYKYTGGINVVVIWPTSPSMITTDSLVDTLTVITVGLWPSNPLEDEVNVYPVPTSGMLYFQYSLPRPAFARMEVTNAAGQVVRKFVGSPSSISLDGLSAGTYWLTFLTEHGPFTSVRVIKD